MTYVLTTDAPLVVAGYHRPTGLAEPYELLRERCDRLRNRVDLLAFGLALRGQVVLRRTPNGWTTIYRRRR